MHESHINIISFVTVLISAVVLLLTFGPELTQEMVLPKQYHPC